MITTNSVEITEKNVNIWLDSFKTNYQPNLIKLYNYYDGMNEIIKQGTVSNRPNYKINVNLANYITDVQTGYFIGKPVTYIFDEENKKTNVSDFQDDIIKILSENDEEEENFSIANDMSIYGCGYEVVMLTDGIADAKERLKFAKLDPKTTFFVNDDTVLKNPVCAIHFYDTKEKDKAVTKGYIYTSNEIIDFTVNNSKISFDNRINHNFKKIPVIKYKNNVAEFGDYEKVTDMLDAISLSISNETDDLQSIANAILSTNGSLDKDTIEAINKSKVAKIPVGGKMEWIIKNINVEAVKHQIDNLTELVYQISKTPDLTSTEFGGQQSGVALEFKLWGLEQSRLQKERYFKTGLIERISLISNIINLSTGKNYEYKNDIEIVFYKNLPQSDDKMINIVKNLSGIVSLKTLLEQISFIKNSEKEIEQINKEKKLELDALNSEGFNDGSED